jgi:hypothetical protein
MLIFLFQQYRYINLKYFCNKFKKKIYFLLLKSLQKQIIFVLSLPWASVPWLFLHEPENRELYLKSLNSSFNVMLSNYLLDPYFQWKCYMEIIQSLWSIFMFITSVRLLTTEYDLVHGHGLIGRHLETIFILLEIIWDYVSKDYCSHLMLHANEIFGLKNYRLLKTCNCSSVFQFHFKIL